MCSPWWRVGVCFPTRAAPSLLVPCSCADPASSQGTIQFISSGPCQRIWCYLQRAALKLLGRCSFSWCICQPLEATVSSPGCGSPSTLRFLVGAPVPPGTAAVAHMSGTKGCLLLCLGPGVLEGQHVKKLVIEINEGKPPSYCPQRLFLVQLF